MAFKNIQAILIPEFAIIITFLDKGRISRGEGPYKSNNGAKFENPAKLPREEAA